MHLIDRVVSLERIVCAHKQRRALLFYEDELISLGDRTYITADNFVTRRQNA